MKLVKNNSYLLLIDEEAEIKEENIAIHDFGMGYDLEIPCDKDNLKSNTRKLVVAYYPLTKEAEELDLPLLPNPFEEDTDVEKLADKEASMYVEKYASYKYESYMYNECKRIFKEGYKAAQSKQFSLEDVKKAIRLTIQFMRDKPSQFRDCEEEIIQTITTQQLPVSFEPKYEANIDNSPYTSIKMNKALKALKESSKIGCKLKTIINSEGKEILVGTYKY